MRLIRWINASAGTGKTHTITELIKSLVNSGVKPESILCLTFTTAGCMEMKHRYMSAKLPGMPQFETVHSFAKSICGPEWEVISEPAAQELLNEATELVLLDKVWEEFYDSMYQIWPTIANDVKQVILSGLPFKDNFLRKYIDRYCTNEKVQLSGPSIKALNLNGMGSVAAKILSNDPAVYEEHFVTKDLKLSKRILPQSFLQDPEYAEENLELAEVFKKILKIVLDSQNSDYLRQSLTCNVFIREVANAYQRLKAAAKLLDFNDMLYQALNKIKSTAEPIMHIRHIFLDEAQDTSEVQWKLVYECALEVLQLDDSSLTVVGDKKQIIYQFNGASRSIYARMKIKLHAAINELNGTWDEIELDKSYRSAQNLLSFVDTVMESTQYKCTHTAATNKRGYIKVWLPMANPKESIKIDRGWSIPAEPVVLPWIQLCVDEIQGLIGKQKLLNEDRLIEADDIAILVPRRSLHNFMLTERLKEAGIPVKQALFGMSSDETVQDLIHAGLMVIDPKNDLTLVSLLKGLHFGWKNEEIEDLVINRDETVWSVLLHSTDPKAHSAMKTIREWMDFPRDLLPFYSKLIFHTDFGRSMLKNFRSEVLAFWEKVISMSKLSLSEFTYHMQNVYEPLSFNRKGVTISTTHASKGKEFNIVFICNSYLSMNKATVNQVIYQNMFLLKGNYELYKAARSKILEEQDNELDRLMYVALTRAKEQLYIIPPMASDNINPKSWYARIIRYLDRFQKCDDYYEILSEVNVNYKVSA